MSYRITEAERKHVFTIEDFQTSKDFEDANPQNTQVKLTLTDNDKLNEVIDFPKYTLQYNYSNNRLRLVVDGSHYSEAVNTDPNKALNDEEGVGYKYSLKNDDVSGFVNNVILVRSNDGKEWTVPINRIRDLIVENNAEISGNLFVDGNTSIGLNLNVDGTVDIVSGLTISNGGATISGDVQITNGTFSVDEGKTTLQDTEIKGTVLVSGLATVSGLLVQNDTNIGGRLDVDGAARVARLMSRGGITANGNLIVSGTSNFADDVTMRKDLTVFGDTIISGGLSVDEFAQFNSDVEISGNTTISGSLEVEEFVKINSDLEVSGNADIGGDAKIDGGVSISGHTTIEDSLEVGKNIKVDGQLDVSGSIESETSVTAPSGKFVDLETDNFKSKNIENIGTFNATGENTLNGETIISGLLYIPAEVEFDNDITFNKNVNIKKDLLVNGDTTLEGDTFIGAPDQIGGITFVSRTVSLDLSPTSWFNFLFKLNENGLTLNEVDIMGMTHRASDGSADPVVSITGTAGGIYTASTLKPGLASIEGIRSDGKSGQLIIIVHENGSWSIDRSHFSVTAPPVDLTDPMWDSLVPTITSGNIDGKDLYVLNNATVNKDLTVKGTLGVSDGTWISGAVAISGDAFLVESPSVFKEDVTFNKNVTISGETGTEKLIIKNEMILDNALSMEEDLYVKGNAYVSGRIDTKKLNDAGTTNKLEIYTSGLSASDLTIGGTGMVPPFYGMKSANRIKTIINDEVQILATLQDINGVSLSGAVTLNTTQNITGKKWFSGGIYTNTVYFYGDGPGGLDEFPILEKVYDDGFGHSGLFLGDEDCPLQIHSMPEDRYAKNGTTIDKKDNHIAVRYGTLPMNYLANVDDIVLPQFANPTNGLVLGGKIAVSGAIEETSGTINFTTLYAQEKYSGLLHNDPTGSYISGGNIGLTLESDGEILFTKVNDNTLKLSISGYEDPNNMDFRFEVENNVQNIVDVTMGLSGDLFDYSDTLTLKGQSGIAISGLNKEVSVGLQHIDFALPIIQADPSEERFPTTRAVTDGIHVEELRATAAEEAISKRIPIAPNALGYYSLTAERTAVGTPGTVAYGWSASTLPPLPLRDSGGNPNIGKEFALKAIIEDDGTGQPAGKLVWELIV